MDINYEELRTKNKIKLALMYKNKTMIWLSSQLKYSPQHMYTCINQKKESELYRIQKIIRNLYEQE